MSTYYHIPVKKSTQKDLAVPCGRVVPGRPGALRAPFFAPLFIRGGRGGRRRTAENGVRRLSRDRSDTVLRDARFSLILSRFRAFFDNRGRKLSRRPKRRSGPISGAPLCFVFSAQKTRFVLVHIVYFWGRIFYLCTFCTNRSPTPFFIHFFPFFPPLPDIRPCPLSR